MVIPLYLQIVKGMSALNSGLTLLFGALMMGVMSLSLAGPLTSMALNGSQSWGCCY